jgi:hypothetical protein
MEIRRITKREALPLLIQHHYLRGRVADPMYVFGWYDVTGELKAAVLYASPANFYFGKGAVELARLVRTEDLREPLSSFVAATLRWLRKNTDLRYCISYSDLGEGHHGGIYQALSFDFVRVSRGHGYWVHPETGERCSSRAFDQRHPNNKHGWIRKAGTDKLLYVKPLNEKRVALFRRFNWTSLPYHKPDKVAATA